MKKPATKAATANSAPADAGDGVAAVERALSIVAALETADHPLALAELAVRTGFYKSTILRLLGSLLTTGYATRLPDDLSGMPLLKKPPESPPPPPPPALRLPPRRDRCRFARFCAAILSPLPAAFVYHSAACPRSAGTPPDCS